MLIAHTLSTAPLIVQVARALLDEGGRSGQQAAARTGPLRLAGRSSLPAADLAAGLAALEAALISELRAELAAGGPAAFEANLDVVVELGWVHVEARCMRYLLEAAAAAPRGAAEGLAAAAALYGASRLERRAGAALARGLMTGADAAALRHAVNGACRELMAGGRGCAALRLCDSFGVPPHLLAAPIAVNWREIGATL
jgi:acyl-CoA oxidase